MTKGQVLVGDQLPGVLRLTLGHQLGQCAGPHVHPVHAGAGPQCGLRLASSGWRTPLQPHPPIAALTTGQSPWQPVCLRERRNRPLFLILFNIFNHTSNPFSLGQMRSKQINDKEEQPKVMTLRAAGRPETVAELHAHTQMFVCSCHKQETMLNMSPEAWCFPPRCAPDNAPRSPLHHLVSYGPWLYPVCPACSQAAR